ncbi:YigZ family protein [Ruminococcaceae bacterium OttesenSCG-928-A16]|nr:YigZ family protein [Ruminococcaceae bacterium OttesenSCG-928-A16]
MESYKTIKAVAQARIVEKKSEFIANVSPATTDDEATTFLNQMRAEHRTANHNVYAYSLRQEARQRYSDDGEPAKTAGLPVLSVLTHTEVVDCIVVVTRYFGGTLLGTGGLVRAYTAAAKAGLAAANVVTIQLCAQLTIVLQYPLYEQALRLLENHGATWAEPIFTDTVTLQATLPHGKETALLTDLNEATRGQAIITEHPPVYLPF